jgi:hypothetical protein
VATTTHGKDAEKTHGKETRMAKGKKNARQRQAARQQSIYAHGKEKKHDKGGFALPWHKLCRAT